MIIITGAAGFIASCLAHNLLRQDEEVKLLLVDKFTFEEKNKNLPDDDRCVRINRDKLFEYLEDNEPDVDCFYHLGARTDTAEQNIELFQRLNIEYSKNVWSYCALNEIPLVYASSAATYGDGSKGFDDNHEVVPELKPLNPYGDSKQLVDLWALDQFLEPPHWYGVKFFNVFGPNEFHKGRMASVVFHAYNQIEKTGKMKLFRSHREDVENGHQSRDFIHVEDVISCCKFLMKGTAENGLYNIGTGKARTFLDLVNAVFKTLDLTPDIEFIDTPEDIRENYQYYTQAEMGKLLDAGFDQKFMTLEEGVSQYVSQHLTKVKYY